LLPPDNATGNFIHIVERVPVRIALRQDEIREHPIRPGLSTVTQINVTESGQSVWSSLAAPSTAEYETDVYADELPTAESLAQEVMTANLVSGVAPPQMGSGDPNRLQPASLPGGRESGQGRKTIKRIGGERVSRS
jgi:membrane fusion protein (multidrug efflux system)